ncbi:MAG: PAS domain S-box protein [Methanophagales archaeon ANME-1-THS]|nr:MAG: PAS domain S-box protein [Methanophagales archaeon ANME-1-THS]
MVRITLKGLLILSFTLACALLAFYLNVFRGETRVYPHLFYIPIILAGMWYGKKALYVALFLSAIYIFVTYYSLTPLSVDVFERSAIQLVVAYIIGLISEKRAQVDIELKETKDYLDDVIKSSADAIVVVDMEGIVRSWNKAAEDYMGYTAAEVLGKSNRRFFADPDEADEIMSRVLRDGELKNYRTQVLRKDKKPVHISMSAALLRDKNGIPIGTVRVSRDITKEVELERKIKEERDNLNLIFENMVDGVYIVSRDYTVEFMNKVLIDAFGDQVGGICYEVFHNRKEPCPQCKNPEVLSGKTIRWEWQSRRKNRTYDLIETPLKNSDGSLSKLTIFRDITARKRIEEELKEAKEYYRVIFEYTLTALCVIEDDKTISFANREFESLSGYSREELVGKKWTDFIAEEDLQKVQNYCEERRKGETASCKSFKFLSRTGEIRYVNAWIEPIPGTKRCIASLLNITELKRKKDKLRDTCKRLAELDKMKREFLSVAYHEMRSPLAPIIGYASLLEPKLADRERRYIAIIEQSARELEERINHMLELARIDGKKVELTLGELAVREVVEKVVRKLEPAAEAKNQVISMFIPELTIPADEQKLHTILTNLLSNAIRYTPEGGRIDIIVEDRGADIRACIADTGPGIPAEHLPKIFERFYMVDTSLTRKSGGLGLGLSIVKEYVKMHGGRVWATSELGRGSQFFFTLPKREIMKRSE